MKAKTPEEITNDILTSLNKQNAPERILLKSYLEIIIERHRKEAVREYIDSQNKKTDVEYKPSHG